MEYKIIYIINGVEKIAYIIADNEWEAEIVFDKYHAYDKIISTNLSYEDFEE
ncbi:MAG: hypothetical protein ABSG25_04135 [Bryobacteraceae bacterium]